MDFRIDHTNESNVTAHWKPKTYQRLRSEKHNQTRSDPIYLYGGPKRHLSNLVGLQYIYMRFDKLLMFTAQTQAHLVEEQEVLQNLGKVLKQMHPVQKCPILPDVGKLAQNGLSHTLSCLCMA